MIELLIGVALGLSLTHNFCVAANFAIHRHAFIIMF